MAALRVMPCGIMLMPRPRRACRCLGHSCPTETADHTCGHPSTNARHTDGSRGGRRATDLCGV
jgi:hypothetical protein